MKAAWGRLHGACLLQEVADKVAKEAQTVAKEAMSEAERSIKEVTAAAQVIKCGTGALISQVEPPAIVLGVASCCARL